MPAYTNGMAGALARTRMCKYALRGECAHGGNCRYAHSEAELRAQPNLAKTALCRNMRGDGMHCGNPRCTYAHAIEELRSTEAVYKTKMCVNPTTCKYGAHCRFAHNEAELRPLQAAPPEVRRTKTQKRRDARGARRGETARQTLIGATSDEGSDATTAANSRMLSRSTGASESHASSQCSEPATPVPASPESAQVTVVLPQAEGHPILPPALQQSPSGPVAEPPMLAHVMPPPMPYQVVQNMPVMHGFQDAQGVSWYYYPSTPMQAPVQGLHGTPVHGTPVHTVQGLGTPVHAPLHATPLHGTPMHAPPHGTPVHAPLQGTPVHTPVHGTPVHGTPVHGTPVHGTPVHGTPVHGMAAVHPQ